MTGRWWCLVLMVVIWPTVVIKNGLTVVTAQNQTVVEIGSVDPSLLNSTTFGHLISPTVWGYYYWDVYYFAYDIHSNVCIVQTQLATAQSGIVYAFELTRGSPSMATYGIPTQIQIIQVRRGNSSELNVIQSIPITLNTTINSRGTIYYFNSTQLFEVEPNDLFGYCFGARPFLFLDRTADQWWLKTTNYVWTPTSYASGLVNSSTITVETYSLPFNIQFYQWNVNLTDLNMTKFEAFYEPLAPPNVGLLHGIDPFNLPPVLLGDAMPSDGLLEKSNISNRCIVPNVPVTESTVVYSFSGSPLESNGHDYVIKLIHVRMINPPTIVLTNSTTTTVKLIQSVDITIGQGTASPRFFYDLPSDQYFSLQAGDFVGYCLDDHNSYTTTPTYFQYQHRPPADGHSVFTFHLGPGSQTVTLRSEVHDFNAHGWKNVTLTQLNGLVLPIFTGREEQIKNVYSSFGSRTSFVSGSGPYTDATAPLLTPIPGLDPSTIVNTTIGGLVSTANTYDTTSDLCTTWQPPIGPGVVYGVRSSLVPSTGTIAPIRLLIGTEQLDTVNNILNMVFDSDAYFDIIVPPSSTATKFEFYFSYEQLFYLPGGSDQFLGFCTPEGQPGVFPWVSDSTNLIRQLTFSNILGGQRIYQDHRRYDFELLQWPNIYSSDLDETETRAWLTKKAIASNQLRPNTYPQPSHSIDPTTESLYYFQYGYQYVDSSSYSIWGQTMTMYSGLNWGSDSTPHCALFGYSKADMGDLRPGIIYSIEASHLYSTSSATTLTIIVAQDVSANQDQSSFKIRTSVNVPIETSPDFTKMLYYFPPDQLLELRVGEYIGACSSAWLLSKTDSIYKTYLYQWSTSDSTLSTAGATATKVTKNQLALDLQVNGWSFLSLDQLNLTTAAQFLSSARSQLGGNARVPIDTPPDYSPIGGGGLSASGQIILWICLAVVLTVGLIAFFIIRRRRRQLALLALVSPAPRLSPAPIAPVSASLAQPKPSGAFVSPESPSVPMVAPMQQSPPPYPSQSQPIVYYSPASPTQHQPIASPSSAGGPDIEMQAIAPSPISNEGAPSNPPLPPYTFNAPMNAQESSVGDGTIRLHLDQYQVQPPSSSSSMVPMSSGPISPSGVIQVRFCPSCGQSRTPPMATFCSACGYKY